MAKRYTLTNLNGDPIDQDIDLFSQSKAYQLRMILDENPNIPHLKKAFDYKAKIIDPVTGKPKDVWYLIYITAWQDKDPDISVLDKSITQELVGGFINPKLKDSNEDEKDPVNGFRSGCTVPDDVEIIIDFSITNRTPVLNIPMSFSHTYTKEPEIGLIPVESIPPAMRQDYRDGVDECKVTFNTGTMTVNGWSGGCLEWGIGTSFDGLGGLLSSYDGVANINESPHDGISYAHSFESFWTDTLFASCDYVDVPKCGSPPDTSTLAVEADGGVVFSCGEGSRGFGAVITSILSMPGHILQITKCEVDGCGTGKADINVTWNLVGLGWIIVDQSGSSISIKPPSGLGCTDCPPATLEATSADGQQASIGMSLDGCPPASTCTTITGSTTTTCAGTYTYTTDGSGSPIWAVESGGASITQAGVLTPPSSNSNCTNNSVISATCGADIVYLSVAHNCYGSNPAVGDFFGACYVNIPPCNLRCSHDWIYCDGTILPYGVGYGGCSASDPCPNLCATGCSFCGTTTDNRTSAEKSGGCCPEQL